MDIRLRFVRGYGVFSPVRPGRQSAVLSEYFDSRISRCRCPVSYCGQVFWRTLGQAGGGARVMPLFALISQSRMETPYPFCRRIPCRTD